MKPSQLAEQNGRLLFHYCELARRLPSPLQGPDMLSATIKDEIQDYTLMLCALRTEQRRRDRHLYWRQLWIQQGQRLERHHVREKCRRAGDEAEAAGRRLGACLANLGESFLSAAEAFSALSATLSGIARLLILPEYVIRRSWPRWRRRLWAAGQLVRRRWLDPLRAVPAAEGLP